jgi:hypothetical protein
MSFLWILRDTASEASLFPIPLLFVLLAFLFPVAIYCLILAVLNSRRHPTLVSGPWDFAGVLFATTGFLLIGGPTILAGLNSQWRYALQHGRFREVRSQPSEWWLLWILIWGVYFVVVIGGAVYVAWRRRPVTIIYNIDPVVFEDVLGRVLDQLGMEGARVANRIFIGYAGGNGRNHSDEPNLEAFTTPGGLPRSVAGPYPEEAEGGVELLGRTSFPRPAANQVEPNRTAVLELEPLPSVQHLTLHWTHGDPSVRRDVEAELAKVLAEVETNPNPAANWFLVVASILFAFILFGLLLLILVQSGRR